jgi:arsenite oxidase small subunit
MQRRDFIKACAASCALGAHEAFAATGTKPRFYSRAQLVNPRGAPIKAGELAVGENYIFHYPFEGTPCFLLDLGKRTRSNVALKTESGAAYQWAGGVGPKRSIVGYSAICAHKLTYPTRQISFISYREKSTASAAMRPNTIHCCSEHSEYDPASGGRVVGGPAPQPLSAILLEHDPTSDALYAIGTLGGEMFNAFFVKYEFRLAVDYGTAKASQRVAKHTTVIELREFCKQQVRC